MPVLPGTGADQVLEVAEAKAELERSGGKLYTV
jgi:hypothetical protein